MAIRDYFDPMDGGGKQIDLLKAVGSEENKGGICLMLSINWAIQCTKAPGTAPNVVWRDNMKGEGPFYFKQIAQQQIGYKDLFRRDPASVATVNSLMELASNDQPHRLHVVDVNPGPDLTLASEMAKYTGIALNETAQQHSTTNPPLCLIFFQCQGGGHCIAAASYNNNTYIYDPNIGVMIVDTNHRAMLMKDLHDMYGIKTVRIGAVTT